MQSDETEKLKDLQFKLGYIFFNPSLLKKALTHSTFVNECQEKDIRDNERLEFLGDSILGFIISDFLHQNFLTYSEGMLSKLKAYIVSEEYLSIISKELDLGTYLKLGKGEEVSGGRNKSSILANTYEAIIGAIYLDGGLAMTKRFIVKDIKNKIIKLGKKMLVPDYKSMLQEYAQKEFGTIPKYELVSETGENHSPIFEIQVIIQDKIYATGTAGSKKKAEQTAANQALKKINML